MEVLDRFQYEDPHICGTCACHRFDWDGEDYVCTNDRSEHFGDWTDYNTTCDEWKEKRHERKKNDHTR